MPPEAQQARQSSTISAPDPKPEPENDASQVTVTEATDPLKQRQRILRQAEQLYSDGDYPGAVNLLRQHLEQRHPRHNTYASDAELRALDADIYRHMALAQLRLERTSAALKTLERGHRHAPDNIDLHMLYARILLEEEKGERAYAMLRDLPQPLLADNPDFYALRAALARNQGVFSEAVELYTLLCRAQPQHGAWRLGLAISQHQQGNLDAAYRNYQLAADSGLEPRLREFASRQAQELFSHK
jgi:thioredoxin-like negative regulator of GroEL